MFRIISLFLIVFFSNYIYCQQQGYSFGALNFNNTARTAALGGYSIAILDNDASTSILLPSNIRKENSGQLVLNYVNYFSDTDYALLNFTHSFKKLGVFSASLIYCNYGSFDYSDPTGVKTGTQFFVYDVMGQIGYSKKIMDKLQLGINLKFISSIYESYSSLAIGSDVSATYYDPKKQFGSSILIQNIGRSIKSFQTNNSKENLPFNIQLSLNKKLSHSPIRFHFVYHDLQKWNISSVSLQDSNTSFQNFSKNLFSHIVLGSEFLFSKNFNIRIGYNFKNRRDLQPISRTGIIGFSWGVGFVVKKLRINYSNSKYHFSGTSNNITLVKSLGKK